MFPIIAAPLPRDWIALPMLPIDKEDDTVVVDAFLVDAVVVKNVDESSHDAASLVATTSELAATNHQSTPTSSALLKPQMRF
jgi:hypothetical protein